MKPCDACGNVYPRSFEVIHNNRNYIFDSLECAISIVAPSCENCGTKIIGHGVENDGKDFCCSFCARKAQAAA